MSGTRAGVSGSLAAVEWLAIADVARASGRAAAGSGTIVRSAAVLAELPWPEASRLDDLVSERLEVPSGSRIRIAYPAPDDPDTRPVVAAKL